LHNSVRSLSGNHSKRKPKSFLAAEFA